MHSTKFLLCMAHTIVFHTLMCSRTFHVRTSIGKSSPNYLTACTFYLEGSFACLWEEFFTIYAFGEMLG